MNTTQEIKVINKHHEETSWKRYITFNYNDEEYKVLLFWDELEARPSIPSVHTIRRWS